MKMGRGKAIQDAAIEEDSDGRRKFLRYGLSGAATFAAVSVASSESASADVAAHHDTHASGGTDAVTATSIGAMAVGSLVTNVKDFGAKGDGTVDDRASIQSAINAVVTAGGGVVWLPPGNYLSASATPITLNSRKVSLQGAGGGATVITHTGSGDCVRINTNPTDGNQGGRISGLRIIGNSNTSACGVHMGDIESLELHDLQIENYTGSSGTGLWVDNRTIWTERTLATKLWLTNNTVGIRFSVNGGATSHGYGRWLDVRLNPFANQVGILFETGVYAYNCIFNVVCNFSGNSSVCFETRGTGGVHRCGFFVTGENGGSGNFSGCVGVKVANGSYFNGFGNLTFNDGGVPVVNQNNNSLVNGGTVSPTLRVVAADAGSGSPAAVADAGVRTNFVGTTSATMVPIIVSHLDGNAGAEGALIGTNIESWFTTILNYVGNAWVLYGVGPGQTMGQGAEICRLGQEGRLKFYGDTDWYRDASGGTPAMVSGNCVRVGKFTTSARPASNTVPKGAMYYDDTVNKPVWNDGVTWRDAMGNPV